MSIIELKGTVVRIGETEQRSESFKSRQLILKTDADTQYPQEINIEFNQAKADLLDVVREGSEVKVSTNLNGRKWTNKEGKDLWFNSINAWKIEVLSQPEEDTDIAF